MKEFSLPYISVSGHVDEGFQILFAESEREDLDIPYFLLQRHFESPDGGILYIESHDETTMWTLQNQKGRTPKRSPPPHNSVPAS